MNESEELSRELHSRSHDVEGHPIGFDSVKRTARRIQVRRRLASGAVAAAVLSIAVPTAFAVNGTMLNGQTPVGPATQSPSPSVAESGAPEPDEVPRLTNVGLERGDDPGVPYASGNTVVLPGGQTFTTGRDYAAITEYGPGWLTSYYDDSGTRLAFLDADGTPIRTQPGSEFVVNADGSQVAYVTDSETGTNELVLAPAIGAESAKVRLPVPAGSGPLGFVEDDAVVYVTGGRDTTVRWTRFDGSSEPFPGLIKAGGATEAGGLVTGMTSVDDLEPGSCWTVMEATSKNRLWDTCDFSLGRFSPDARYVLGQPAYRDGIGDGEVAILDARSGDVLVHLKSGGPDYAFVSKVCWEDESHALATVYQDGAWAIVRIGVDGSVERASDLVPGEDLSPPLSLLVP